MYIRTYVAGIGDLFAKSMRVLCHNVLLSCQFFSDTMLSFVV